MTISDLKTSKQIAILEEQAVSGKPLCIILAKKNSQRLPRKNKLPINGKPMIRYAIDAAIKSDIFGKQGKWYNIVISSDDDEILEIAYDNSCMPHKRPTLMANKKTQMKDVVKYLMGFYSIQSCSCLLTPCNPFLTGEDLSAGYKMFIDKNANYVLSVKEARPPPIYARSIVNGCLDPKAGLLQSQKYKPMYYFDGGFIWFRPEAFVDEFQFGFYGTKCYPYITPHQTIDIDTQEDYEYAKYLMRKKK